MGVTIEALDGISAGVSATTNVRGEFSFTEPFDSGVTFRASKDGFVAAMNKAYYWPSAPTNGGVSFRLVSLALPTTIAGDYDLTLAADPACGTWNRTYKASIATLSGPNFPPGTNNVTLSGAEFFRSYRMFIIAVVGEYVSFQVSTHDPAIVEQLAPNTYLAIEGWAEATFDIQAVTPVSTSFAGFFEYCAVTAGIDSESYSCPATATTRTRCQSSNHRLTLTRR